MVDVVLLVVLLNNGLSDDLLSGNFNSLSSQNVVDLGRCSHSIQLHTFVLSSSDLEVYVFSLDNGLNVCFLVDFSSRSLDGFYSFIFSNNRLSLDGVQVYDLVLLRDKLNLLSLIDNFSLQNGLIVNFFIRSIIILGDNLFAVFNRSQNFSMIHNLIFSLLDIQNLLLDVANRLNVSFSVNLSSGNVDGNTLDNFLCIDNSVFDFLFSVNRSFYFGFSDNGSLDNSLFDHGLRNDSFSDDRLGNNFSLNLRLGDNFLSLHDLRSRIQNLISIRGFNVSILSVLIASNLTSSGVNFVTILILLIFLILIVSTRYTVSGLGISLSSLLVVTIVLRLRGSVVLVLTLSRGLSLSSGALAGTIILRVIVLLLVVCLSVNVDGLLSDSLCSRGVTSRHISVSI